MLRIALNPETDQELRHEGVHSTSSLDVWLLLGGLALVGAYRMLTGGINMRGLLDDNATGEPRPGSVQSLTLAVMAANTAPADL